MPDADARCEQSTIHPVGTSIPSVEVTRPAISSASSSVPCVCHLYRLTTISHLTIAIPPRPTGITMSLRPTLILLVTLLCLVMNNSSSKVTGNKTSYNVGPKELANNQEDHNQEHGSPDHQPRKATARTRKVHRAVGWTVGTMMTLALVLVIVATVSVTSKGTQTQPPEEVSKGCCCRIFLWLTKTSSQLPLWKSLAIKFFVTCLSTLAAGLFSLLLTNLLAEEEESIEATVRDILGLGEEDNGGRQKREAQPDKIHWLAVLFVGWLTTIPLICYIVVSKLTDKTDHWTVRERAQGSRIEDQGVGSEDQGEMQTTVQSSNRDSTISLPPPPSMIGWIPLEPTQNPAGETDDDFAKRTHTKHQSKGF